VFVVQVSIPLPDTVTGTTKPSKLHSEAAHSELVMVEKPTIVCVKAEVEVIAWSAPTGSFRKNVTYDLPIMLVYSDQFTLYQ
jgi:hypothetical protein